MNPGATAGSLTQIQLVGKNSTHRDIPFWRNDWKDIAPSLGFSYKVPRFARPTVIRGGYGINYSGNIDFLDYELSFFSAPGTTTSERPAPAGYLDLAGIASKGVFPLTPSAKPLAPIPLTSDRTQSLNGTADDRITPYIQSFNLSVQRELTKDLTLEVGYVGNKGTKLLDIIQLNEPNIFQNGILDAFNMTRAGANAPLFDRVLMGLNVPGVGTVNGTTLMGSQAFRRSPLTRSFFANGSVAAFANFLNTSNAITGQFGGLLRNAKLPENFIVVNPQFGSDRLWSSGGSSTYHSLQLQLRKRVSQGVSGQFSYTFSKALGNAVTLIDESVTGVTNMNTIDYRNRSRNKGPLSFDRRHIFNVSGTWELPFGPGRPFLAGGPGWMHRIVEGWQLSSIAKYTTGGPLNILTLVRTLGSTSNLGVPDIVGNVAKNLGQVRVGSGFVEYFPGLSTKASSTTAVFGSDPDGLARFVTNRNVVDASGNVLLQNPIPGTAGNMGAAWVTGPGNLRFDLSLSKRVRIGEQKTLTFRADAVNFLNTPQWDNPNLDINSNSFGRITTATGARTVTLGGRIDF
jgi:hypothetical protein